MAFAFLFWEISHLGDSGMHLGYKTRGGGTLLPVYCQSTQLSFWEHFAWGGSVGSTEEDKSTVQGVWGSVFP